MITKSNIIIMIILTVLVIIFAARLYMKKSCTGLWERQVSKIPRGFPGTPGADDYTKCVYIGFDGMMKKFRQKDK